MKKNLLIIILMAVISTPGLLAGVDPFASPGAPVSTGINPYDWFQTGETVEAFQCFTYYRAVSDSMKDRFLEHRNLLQKIGASPASIQVYNELASVALSLPFDKELDQWSPEEKPKLKGEVWPAADKLVAAMKQDAAKSPDRDYFYWLGFQALKADFVIPEENKNFGTSMPDLAPMIKGMLADFDWLKGGELFKSLTAEVQSAVTSLAAMAGRASKPIDPLTGKGGMSPDDITKMQGFAHVIREAAKANKLVR